MVALFVNVLTPQKTQALYDCMNVLKRPTKCHSHRSHLSLASKTRISAEKNLITAEIKNILHESHVILCFTRSDSCLPDHTRRTCTDRQSTFYYCKKN